MNDFVERTEGILKGARSMSKATVTWIFAAACVAVAVGSVLALAATLGGIGDAVRLGGAQIIAINGAAFAGTLVWLVLGWALIGVGAVLAVASWIGAVFNTAKLADHTWFVALLVLGVCSFGWVAMIAYILAGPDGTRGHATRRLETAS